MSWPITWPAAANIGAVDVNIKRLCELYASACMNFLTLNRAGGDSITITPAPGDRVLGWYGTYQGYAAGIFWPVYPSAVDLKSFLFLFEAEAVRLPGPVGTVSAVTIDGELLDASQYRVEDGIHLVRLEGSWPSAGLRVTYTNSIAVDEMGAHAAGVMAAEWLKLITAEKNCRLNTSARTVTRQGITMDLVGGLFPDGVTNIPEIDAYTMLLNPYRLRVAPRVWSPDLQRPHQVTS